MGIVFIDTDIPIYAVGQKHNRKQPCLKFLHRMALRPKEAVSDTEVLEELLRHYWSTKSLNKAFGAFERFATAIPMILPVRKQDILRAKEILTVYKGISPREAIHAAVVLNRGIKTVCSYEKNYDRIKEISRIEP